MVWRLNPALTTFRSEVNERYPNRDKGSDGTIGDVAHQNTNSDHNPDSDGSVDAWDMDVELNGVGKPYAEDLAKVISVALRHESIQYIIYSRRITSRTWGLGVWRKYEGANPHDKHVHFNTRTSHERSIKPWFSEVAVSFSKDEMRAFPWQYNGNGMPGVPTGKSTLWVLGSIFSKVTEIGTMVSTVITELSRLSQTPPGTVTISDEQLERVLRKVIGSVDNS